MKKMMLAVTGHTLNGHAQCIMTNTIVNMGNMATRKVDAVLEPAHNQPAIPHMVPDTDARSAIRAKLEEAVLGHDYTGQADRTKWHVTARSSPRGPKQKKQARGRTTQGQCRPSRTLPGEKIPSLL